MPSRFYITLTTLLVVYFQITNGVDVANSNIDWSTAVVDKCTTIIVAKGAGRDGPMTTHTADCSNCDFRVNKVPAKEWPKGSKRPLYLYKGDYPALISKDRGATWHPDNLEGTPEQLAAWGQESVITGYIPQVPHTYALIEAGYGIMNEHQVAIGESTCAARFWAAPTSAGGKAAIEVRQMSQIALERAVTAASAVQIMGDLATTYGFYAADWSGGDMSKGEGGEALTVIDKNEAWVFHVLADDTGTSAVWAAQRLPEGHVAAVANQFIIRHIDPNSPDFMYSSNLFDVARRNGLWTDADGQLDFLKTFAPPRAHSPYATRRVWRVFSLVAPDVAISPYTDPYASDYPFSVKAAKVLSPEDVMALNRDHYEGTEFDLTKGLGAGPYGDPNRFDMSPQPKDNLTFFDVLQGSYERSISLFRTSYSFVAVSRAHMPDILALLWFSQYAPSSSSYVPLYVASSSLPRPYTRGNLFKYDPTVSFWNFCAVGNYAARFYRYAMEDVFELQHELQQKANSAIESLEGTVLSNWFTPRKLTETISTTDNNESQEAPVMTWSLIQQAVTALVTTLTISQGDDTVISWASLLPKLITKYHDGYRAENLDQPSIAMKKLFYTKFWLDATGYWNNKPNTGGDTIMFAPSAIGISATYSSYTVVTLILLTFILSVSLGVILAPHIYNIKPTSSSIPFSSSIDDVNDHGIQMKQHDPSLSAYYQPSSINTNESSVSMLSDGNQSGKVYDEPKKSLTGRVSSFVAPSSIPFALTMNVLGSKTNRNSRPNRTEYISLDI